MPILYNPAPVASSTVSGYMTSADKSKLDSINLLGVKLNTTSLTPDNNGIITVPLMTGATLSTNGVLGLVPAPSSGDENKFLSGDGTWKTGLLVNAQTLTTAQKNQVLTNINAAPQAEQGIINLNSAFYDDATYITLDQLKTSINSMFDSTITDTGKGCIKFFGFRCSEGALNSSTYAGFITGATSGSYKQGIVTSLALDGDIGTITQRPEGWAITSLNERLSSKVDKIINLANQTDYDTLLTSGFYHLQNQSNYLIKSVDVSYGEAEIIQGGDTVVQKITACGANKTFIRTGYYIGTANQAFTSWEELAMHNDVRVIQLDTNTITTISSLQTKIETALTSFRRSETRAYYILFKCSAAPFATLWTNGIIYMSDSLSYIMGYCVDSSGSFYSIKNWGSGLVVQRMATTNETPPKSHASTATTYGVGNASNYGHVKLSDNYTSSAGAASASIGASSKAVYDAYTAVNNKVEKNSEGTITFNGNAVSSSSGSVTWITSKLLWVTGTFCCKAVDQALSTLYFTLPANYRPAKTGRIYAMGVNHPDRFITLDIYTNGEAKKQGAGSTSNVADWYTFAAIIPAV